MKQIALILSSLVLLAASASAQTDSTKSKKKDWSKLSLNNRANDHFMLQLGYAGWTPLPDSIKTKGFSRSINAYFMMDLPFKTDQRFSVGIGLGISSDHIKFNKVEPNVIAQSSTLPFTNRSDTTHFKKFKLVTAYIEAPVELRFVLDPEHSDNSWKFAAGVKLGLMVNAHTRGKTLVNSSGQTINNYVQKETSRSFFNGTRIMGTARVGYGHVSLFGQYALTALIRDSRGPVVHPYSIGITFSGL
ncbi:MAG: outer membrane beta-barrel protein [Bacteroidota bacterium]|nr:outer membrane beta-barrel protein [Bacteroidota bacterium]